MKAAVFYGKHQMHVEDIPEKEPEKDEVLIRVRYCGVCGTDVHIFEGDKGSAEVVPPRILGHELSGEIVKTGTEVHRLKKGDRVAVDPNDYCGTCYFCRNGKKHLCRSMIGIGTAADGGFAEYITVKEHLVYKIPDSLSFKEAAMAEPVSCCLHGMQLADIKIGDTVMVVGTGSIGLIMIQLARYMGAEKIIAVEPSDTRREKAGKYGAGLLLHPDRDKTEEILREYGIENIDKVIDCAGKIATAQYCVKYAGKGATVLLFGLTSPDDAMEIKPFEIFQKELTIKSSFVNPDTFEKSIRLLQKGIVKTEDIITDIIELEDIESVFAEKLYNRNGKVLIKMTAQEEHFDLERK